MSSYYSLNERNNIRSKRAYFEDEVQNEINNYIKQKKIKIKGNEDKKQNCNSLNFKQKLLPPSPPLDYIKYQTCYEDENFMNFSLYQFPTNTECISSSNNNQKNCSSQECNIQECNYNISQCNTNVQNKKKYIPKFTIGYRNDCKKCREGIPNHYGHIN